MACFLFYVNKICRTKDKDENSELVTAISRTALSQAEKENNPFGNENSQICYFFLGGGVRTFPFVQDSIKIEDNKHCSAFATFCRRLLRIAYRYVKPLFFSNFMIIRQKKVLRKK